MKGSKCKCGFATEADRRNCPRCGKPMKNAEWKEEGKVLSITELGIIPEGFEVPQNLVLVEIKGGPKVICWSTEKLAVHQMVTVEGAPGKRTCSSHV